jgi:hypothetical protein
VAITFYGCDGNASIVADVSVVTNGAAAGTLTLDWYVNDGNVSSGKTVHTETVTLPQVQTTMTARYIGNFADYSTTLYWGLNVATDPAAATGNHSFETIDAENCQIQ